MGKHDLGNKDIHKDAAALAPLLAGILGGTGGGNFPQFIVPQIGRNETDATDIPLSMPTSGKTLSAIVLPADKVAWGLAHFLTPAGYTGTITISMVVYMPFTQTMIFRMTVVDGIGPPQTDSSKWDDAGSIGGSTTETITSSGANGVYAVARHTEDITFQTLIFLQGVRRGTDAGDTSAEDARFYGFMIEYG